jgi:hypothetical protein
MDLLTLNASHGLPSIPTSCSRQCPEHDRPKLTPENAVAPKSYTRCWDIIPHPLSLLAAGDLSVFASQFGFGLKLFGNPLGHPYNIGIG